MIVLKTLAVLLALVFLFGILYQRRGMRTDASRFPAPGELVDIGNGHRLHIHVSGNETPGSPTVVLEAGIAATSLSWQQVQPRVAKFARVCSYDRTGLGWSETTGTRPTPGAIARELHALLAVAELPAPYLLVGHSFGGIVVQRFASLFPEETSGLVLVDPLSPSDWLNPDTQRKRMLWGGAHLSRRGAMLARIGVVRGSLNSLMRGGKLAPKVAGLMASGKTASGLMGRLAGEVQKLPRESWPMVASHWSNPKCFESMAQHLQCLPESSAEVAAIPAMHLPAAVILAEHVGRAGTDPAPALPDATRIVALGSGHWPHLDAPELVIQAIRQVMQQAADAGPRATSL